MNKNWKSNFEKEAPIFKRAAGRELVIAFMLGTIPVFFNSGTSQEFQKTVESLLASDSLINHAALLLTLHLIISALLTRHLKSDSTKTRLNYLHGISSEIGSTFLAILRAGLGAILGFLLVITFKNIGETTTATYISATAHAFLAFITTAAYSFLHELLKPKHFNSHYKNELVLPARL